jgi:hypothetical protein
LRRSLLILLCVVSAIVALALSAAQSASAAQRIDMKVLLLGTSTTEPDFAAWQAALQREGVPFDAIVTAPGHAPITAATLSSTLPDGTQEGKYQAIIVSVGALPECGTSCVPTLTQSEWTALEEYEQGYNVRQLTGIIFPSATYGMNAPTVSGEFPKGTQGTLTTAGKSVFPYLSGPMTLDVGTYGYEATPLTTQASGASFNTLISGPGNSALLGIYTHPNGIQEMVVTFNQNRYQLQAELLRHGVLNWVTRGVYFGDQRNYFEAHIDDNFLSDDSWSTATHSNDYLAADAIREVPADIEYAAKWSQQNNLRIDMLFNGGGSVAYAEAHTGGDPLLPAFQTYKNVFGWANHTWDHPNVDVGCASQTYIEAELNQNNSWATSSLGLTASTSPTAATGNNNPSVIVTGEHSGLANLRPGNPGVVDPPFLSLATVGAAGTQAAGSYVYAVTDNFVSGGGQSTGSQSAPVTITGSQGSVTLSWDAVCHAAEFKVYREVANSNAWKLLATISAPTTPPPNSWFASPTTNTAVTGGGAEFVEFTDTGAAGTASSGPPASNGAVETAFGQNPSLAPAFQGVGIKYFGSDASKAYPDPTIPGSTTEVYPAGSSFLDATAQAIPRYPTNIYYNTSTETQELDEFNALYTPVSKGGKCVESPTTTCRTSPANFAEVVSNVDSNIFQHLMGNDPRPHYFHQTNLMGTPPPGPPTTGTPPNTPPAKGDGLFYSAMNSLLEQYKAHFNTPIEQPTVAQIGQLLTQQQVWSQASAGQVSGYIEGNQVTIQNSGSSAVNAPLTGVTGVGASYGGIQSGWTSVPAATSTLTAATAWPAAPAAVQQEPQGSWVSKVGSAGYLLADWNGAQDLSNLPNVTASLVQGSSYQWTANSSDTRALQGPDGPTRNAAAYYDPSQVQVKLSFTTAYSGNLHLYAVDWDSTARRETIAVDDGSGARTVALSSDFSKGAWVSFPINVPAGGAVTVTAKANAGANAVLSGAFIGDAGSPPATTGQELSQGGWVGGIGSAGYDLAGWDGPTGDVSYLPNASLSLVQGARYVWAQGTTDARALSDPGQLTRNAATYYDPSQIQVKLTFTAAYSGSVRVYALDWDSTARRETITVNGQTAVLSSSFSKGAWISWPIGVAAGGTVTITVDRTAGSNAVLSGIFLGEAGAPPGPAAASAPQGTWVKAVGSAGYDLAGWDGPTGDVSYLQNASLSLVQGSRYQWAAASTDARALSDPTGVTHNAGTYYDPNQIQLTLSFPAAYTGNLRLYAVDWDKLTRREIVTVNGQSAVLGDFSEGAWVTFPINVPAGGGTVTITVDRTFGPNAVLSGVFLGDAGSPPAMPVPSAPQGNWVGTYGSVGYDLLAFSGSSDLTSLTNASVTVEQASRYQWAPSTADARALQSPNTSAGVAATLYEPDQIKLALHFTAPYTGNLELYALDWDSTARRELVTVNGQTAVLAGEFNAGAWVTFPISVAAGDTVTITVDRLAGVNAVLSGIFLG